MPLVQKEPNSITFSEKEEKNHCTTYVPSY